MLLAGSVVGFRIALGRLVDVRAGELRAASSAFGTLLVISAAHAGLETARDALLVTRLTQREFAMVYIAVAACAIPATGLINRLHSRLGPRTVLLLLLALSAGAAALYASLPVVRWSVVGLYVTVGLIASCVFPQFWLMTGSLLTLAQSRRLVGPIASAGVLGAVAGAALAAGVVSTLPIRALLAICAALFGVGAVSVLCVAKPDVATPSAGRKPHKLVSQIGAFREEPFLLRIAALVVLTTATALVIDYFFKWTIARSMPVADRGRFIARYYLAMNAVSLVLQVLLSASIVRRLGVATALMVTPFLSLVGGVTAALAGASVLPILLLKGMDGSVRSSLNRLTTELVYMPVSPSGRQRAKPFIDGALMRIAQATTAAGILALGARMSAPIFSGLVVILAASWLVATLAMRRPYIGQLRRSLSPLFPAGPTNPEPIDVASAELLVENLGSDDSRIVSAAMSTLMRRGRHRLIPALVLLHPDERVLRQALDMFATEPRTDWFTLGNRLLRHPSETIRLSAARALAAHGELDASKLSSDSTPSVRGYATVFELLRRRPDTELDRARIANLLQGNDLSRLGMLAAVADAEPSEGASLLLLALADSATSAPSPAWTELLARASVRLREPRMIPRLLPLLAHREGRESIKSALVALGDPACTAVAEALNDAAIDRQIRLHLPAALAGFGTKGASEALLECIEHDADGRVRYKAIRALESVVSNPKVRPDRLRVELCVRKNLTEYFPSSRHASRSRNSPRSRVAGGKRVSAPPGSFGRQAETILGEGVAIAPNRPPAR